MLLLLRLMTSPYLTLAGSVSASVATVYSVPQWPPALVFFRAKVYASHLAISLVKKVMMTEVVAVLVFTRLRIEVNCGDDVCNAIVLEHTTRPKGKGYLSYDILLLCAILDYC